MATSVLVTGASGYIGQQVAIHFRNAGYRVYGLVRSIEKGAHLIRHEVIPVVGDLNNPSTFLVALNASAIVVDTVLDFTQKDPFAPNRGLLEATAKSAAELGVVKTYIYTSGVLVYPNSTRVQDESSSLKADDTAPLFKGRIAFENEVLSHTGVRGIVLRPGFVYGGATGAGNFLASFFANDSSKDKIVLNNELKGQRWPWVHIADLADGYVRTARNAHIVKGEAINLVSENAPSYEELTLAGAKVAGFKGTVEYNDEKDSGFLFTLANKTVLLRNDKAFDLLGWRPTHVCPLDEIEIYYHTVKGSWN